MDEKPGDNQNKIKPCLRNSGAQDEIQMKYQRRRCSVRWEQRDVDKNLFREIFEHILLKKGASKRMKGQSWPISGEQVAD